MNQLGRGGLTLPGAVYYIKVEKAGSEMMRTIGKLFSCLLLISLCPLAPEAAASTAPFDLEATALFPPPTSGLPYLVLESGDYDGDGVSEAAIFREASGLWAVRGLSRAYFGTAGDLPVPGDYNGSGWDQAAIFRPSSGLWLARGGSRVYFGTTGDIPVPRDYDDDGITDYAIFRPQAGLWAVTHWEYLDRTRFYYGAIGDIPVSH